MAAGARPYAAVPVSSSPTPLSVDQRGRALRRGLAGLAGELLLLLGVGRLTAVLQLDDRWAVNLIRFALLGADAALVFSVWHLGLARNRQRDWRGWGALVLMLIAWPLLLMFVAWTAIAAWVWITGQPFRPYGP